VEKLPALVMTAIIFWLGVQPTWFVRWSEPTTTALVATTLAGQEQQVATIPAAAELEIQTPNL
jgi:NAD(P)H-quinone oxidoreductase subunit 4